MVLLKVAEIFIVLDPSPAILPAFNLGPQTLRQILRLLRRVLQCIPVSLAGRHSDQFWHRVLRVTSSDTGRLWFTRFHKYRVHDTIFESRPNIQTFLPQNIFLNYSASTDGQPIRRKCDEPTYRCAASDNPRFAHYSIQHSPGFCPSQQKPAPRDKMVGSL